eukprot:6214810-Pleurochrysis_carterae.AAC.8
MPQPHVVSWFNVGLRKHFYLCDQSIPNFSVNKICIERSEAAPRTSEDQRGPILKQGQKPSLSSSTATLQKRAYVDVSSFSTLCYFDGVGYESWFERLEGDLVGARSALP